MKHNPQKSVLREADRRLLICLEKVNTYLLSITRSAYKNTNLVFNPVLSRSPFASDLIRKVVFKERAQSQTLLFVLAQLVRYYAKSSFRFVHYISIFLYVKYARKFQTRVVRPGTSQLTVIDTYAIVDRILHKGIYQEQYFPGLPNLFQDLERAYVIFPVLDRYPLSLWKAHKVVQVLRQSDYPIVTEFDLVELADLVALLKFIFVYPLDVIILAKSVRGTSELGKLLCAELVGTLHQSLSPISGFIRYASAKRLAKATKCHINLISWCENKVIGKGLYRGLRECAPSVLIYACQNYFASPAYINIQIAESEIEAKVTPDIILVNGFAFLLKSDKLQYRLGPSLRYRWIFSEIDTGVNKSGCVICLSYLPGLSNEILEVCGAADSLSELPIPVRVHPAFANHTLPRLPNNWYYTEKQVPQLLRDAALLVTSESGTAIEAAAVGTSVIIIASQSSFTCNPMLQIGKGELWDIAFDPGEVDTVYSHLFLFRQNNPIRIQELTEYYKTHCFVEPTVEAIKNAFDL